MMTTQYIFDGTDVSHSAPQIVEDLTQKRMAEDAERVREMEKRVTRTVGILVDQKLDEFIAEMSVVLEEADIQVELESKDFHEVYNHMCDIVEESVFAYLENNKKDEEDEDDNLIDWDEEDEDDDFPW